MSDPKSILETRFREIQNFIATTEAPLKASLLSGDEPGDGLLLLESHDNYGGVNGQFPVKWDGDWRGIWASLLEIVFQYAQGLLMKQIWKRLGDK